MFDGLLPEPHNTRVLKLLFDLAHWHGLAKLRMHTDSTLDILSRVTTSLGNSLREFDEKTCAMFQTRELEQERAARQRRQEKNTANSGVGLRPAAPSNNARKLKHLNLKTYKYHALGDYVSTIRRFGTTDSYSTQPVSSQLDLPDAQAAHHYWTSERTRAQIVESAISSDQWPIDTTPIVKDRATTTPYPHDPRENKSLTP